MSMELITNTGDLITEEGVKGNVVITNLIRRLMPIIRYPMDDAAECVDYRSRRFRLCGRGAVGVRVGPASYDMTSLKEISIEFFDRRRGQWFPGSVEASTSNGRDGF